MLTKFFDIERIIHRLLLSVFFLHISCAYSQPETNISVAFNMIRPQNMWRHLKILTAFPDRNANSQYGIKAENWLREQIENMLRQAKRTNTQLYTIKTAWQDQKGRLTHFPQSSIMLKIGNSQQPGVVIGAHFDTVGCEQQDCASKPNLHRPGADDNGSGTAILLEVAHILLASNMQLEHPVYLIWYAAEEDDLDGSKSVVTYFIQHNVPVSAVMQLDMTGFAKNNSSTLWLTDSGHYKHVDKHLTRTMYQLAKKYIRKNVAMTHLDDESDHWSWHEAGYKTIFPMESNCHGNNATCPYREHTARDTMETLSLAHMTDYLKLALLFAVMPLA